MQRRPQRRIRKTFIIAAVMRGRQIQHRQRAGAQCLDFGKRFLLQAVADPAAGTHPDRAGFLHHRQQCGSQSPGHGFVGLPRATRFETTTRFTGSPPDGARVLTTIHQYGSSPPFQRNETKFGPREMEPGCSSAKNTNNSRKISKLPLISSFLRNIAPHYFAAVVVSSPSRCASHSRTSRGSSK